MLDSNIKSHELGKRVRRGKVIGVAALRYTKRNSKSEYITI